MRVAVQICTAVYTDLPPWDHKVGGLQCVCVTISLYRKQQQARYDLQHDEEACIIESGSKQTTPLNCFVFFWKRKTSKRNGQNTRETFKYVPVIYFNYANKPIWWACAAARSRINRMSPLTKPTRVSGRQTWTVQTIRETSCPFLRVCCQGVGNQRAELYEKKQTG